jgi:hypothetical protein
VSAETRDAVKAWLGMRMRPATPSSTLAADADVAPALHAWVRAATPPSALFFTDDFDFRIQTRRAITGSFKDGALLFLAGSRPFTTWYELQCELMACRAAAGRGCWFGLARRLHADYTVLRRGGAEADNSADFRPVWARGDVEVWQRVR